MTIQTTTHLNVRGDARSALDSVGVGLLQIPPVPPNERRLSPRQITCGSPREATRI